MQNAKRPKSIAKSYRISLQPRSNHLLKANFFDGLGVPITAKIIALCGTRNCTQEEPTCCGSGVDAYCTRVSCEEAEPSDDPLR